MENPINIIKKYLNQYAKILQILTLISKICTMLFVSIRTGHIAIIH